MRIVIAPDSFKECASSLEVCRAIEEGLRRVLPEADLVSVPMADGGEGTVDALVAATSGDYVEAEVRGPLGEPLRARYGVLGGGRTAVIEMAAASGLALVPQALRDPGITTTLGTGDLIRHAVEGGAERIILGIGGSATNDGGAGMAQALGYSLRGRNGVELEPGGLALAQLEDVNENEAPGLLNGVEVVAACDVDNPLCGPRGASLVYGPQKGATPELARRLDEALLHFGRIVEGQLGIKVLDVPGAGAAGGLGAGVLAFARGRLRPGVEVVAEAVGLAELLDGAGLVITGEGRLDGQSRYGKTPVGVARLAKERGIPVVAFAGALGPDYRTVYTEGIDAAFSVSPGPMDLDEAMERVIELLADAVEAFARSWRAAKGLGVPGGRDG